MRSVLRALISGYDYLVLYLGLAFLGILCIAWSLIALIVYRQMQVCPKQVQSDTWPRKHHPDSNPEKCR